MKKDTHPTYHKNAKIVCACGNVIEVGSTMEKIDVELCSSCHPFYTGKQKLVDTARRVEKFKEKMEKKVAASETRKGRTSKTAKRKEQKTKKTK